MTMHTGFVSVVSNAPLWSVYLPQPEEPGSGNHGDSVRLISIVKGVLARGGPKIQQRESGVLDALCLPGQLQLFDLKRPQ